MATLMRIKTRQCNWRSSPNVSFYPTMTFIN